MQITTTPGKNSIDKKRSPTRRMDWAMLAALVLALPLIMPFLLNGPGLPVTADGEIHLHRLISAAINIQAGHWWPRWAPYLHQGYGYPIHNFYSPGLHVLGALLLLALRIDPVWLVKLLQIGFSLLYPLGAYRFALTLGPRRVPTWTTRAGALAAAAAYTYTPFRFHELWVQGNLSQFSAMALLPWLLWAITRSSDQPGSISSAGMWRHRISWAILTGLLFAAMLLLHHPTGFLAAPLAGGYALLLMLRPRVPHFQASIAPLAGLALGLVLSAVFWLPALIELQYTQIDAIRQNSAFSTAANLLPLSDLLAPNNPVDRTMLNTPVVLRAGQAQLIAALVGLLALVTVRGTGWRWLKVNVLVGVLLTGACLWLMTPDAARFWSAVPLANLIVYPWRLLGVLAVAVLPGAAALPLVLYRIIVAILRRLKQRSALRIRRWRGLLAPVLTMLFALAALPLLYLPLTFHNVPPPSPDTAIHYEQQTGNVGLTSGDEYLPVWVTERPLGVSKTTDYSRWQWQVPLNDPLPAGVTVEASSVAAGVSQYTVRAVQPTALQFHQMYFPGWRVTVNSQITQTTQTQPYATITVQIPAGSSQIAIWYEGIPVQHAAEWISLIALVGSLLTLLLVLWPRQKLTLPVTTRLRYSGLARGEQVLIVIVVGFVVLNVMWIEPYTSLFRPRSDPSAPPAQNALHEIFADESGPTLELLGYDLNSTSARPYQPISLNLYWRLLKPVQTGYRGVVLLTSPNGAQTWGKVESFNLSGTNTRQWPLDRYAVDHYDLRVEGSAPPFLGQLSVGVFTSEVQPLRFLPTSQGSSYRALTDIRINGDWKNVPDSQISGETVRFGDQVKLLGTRLQPDSTNPTRQCVTLRWQPERADLGDYAVMLHLLDRNDGSGQMLSAADGSPLDGLYPTNAWQPGQILDDTHCFAVPAGAVSVVIGLYNRADGQRLSAVPASGQALKDDALVLSLTGK